MNQEHQQQHKGKYLASCWDCVNEMRLECIQLLAEVACGDWHKLGCGVQHNVEGDLLPRDTDTLNARVTAAVAYLANTTFTDDAKGNRDEQKRYEGHYGPAGPETGEDIHEWIRRTYPSIGHATGGSLFSKMDIVVMLRNAAGDGPLQKLELSLSQTWGNSKGAGDD